jgi:hypothetical protein
MRPLVRKIREVRRQLRLLKKNQNSAVINKDPSYIDIQGVNIKPAMSSTEGYTNQYTVTCGYLGLVTPQAAAKNNYQFAVKFGTSGGGDNYMGYSVGGKTETITFNSKGKVVLDSPSYGDAVKSQITISKVKRKNNTITFNATFAPTYWSIAAKQSNGVYSQASQAVNYAATPSWPAATSSGICDVRIPVKVN